MLSSRAAFLGAAAAVTFFPARVRAQGLTKIRIAGSADGSIIGSLWAQQSGVYQKYGLGTGLEPALMQPLVDAAFAYKVIPHSFGSAT